jgi:hypothetical protein
MALGTAVVGTVILSVSLASIGSQVDESTVLTQEVKAEVEAVLERDVNTAGTEDLERALEAAPPEVQDEAEQIFTDGTINGFQAAILAGALVALIGALLTFRLPSAKLRGGALEQAVRDPAIPGMQLEMEDL